MTLNPKAQRTIEELAELSAQVDNLGVLTGVFYTFEARSTATAANQAAITTIDHMTRQLAALRVRLIDEQEDRRTDHPFLRPGLISPGALVRCMQCGREESRHAAARDAQMGA